MINNYMHYVDEMDKSLVDKLWFMNDADIANADIIVDYGCADGSLLRAIHKLNPDAILYGYDIDPIMIESAMNINNDAQYSTSLPDLRNETDKVIVVIMSSLLHELYHYTSDSERLRAMHDLRKYVHPSYIVVRDMVNPKNFDINTKDSSRLISAINASKVEDHTQVMYQLFGRSYVANIEEAGMFIFKYRFFRSGNWSRERYENYFSYDLQVDFVDDLLARAGFTSIYNVLEYKTLDFINRTTEYVFSAPYPAPTHVYAILDVR